MILLHGTIVSFLAESVVSRASVALSPIFGGLAVSSLLCWRPSLSSALERLSFETCLLSIVILARIIVYLPLCFLWGLKAV